MVNGEWQLQYIHADNHIQAWNDLNVLVSIHRSLIKSMMLPVTHERYTGSAALHIGRHFDDGPLHEYCRHCYRLLTGWLE